MSNTNSQDVHIMAIIARLEAIRAVVAAEPQSIARDDELARLDTEIAALQAML